ncbi:MAG: bifunctional ADP-dependent NAD(P)H-hydrate dehydratase/NAD(P)H-hydrate epimerase [Novosphingobium sp.]|nr:bifunctional ADP-dependent NAD(P)H-hydrate dehydratase/NAD(P)H-hydrate epimerase [Novosphingobium sp.]
MHSPADQILTVAQMRDVEAALIASGTSVDELMQRAASGAAEWVWRLAAGRQVTVLCGPGNNGGDGWVIAEAIRARGGKVSVIAAADPATDAARHARSLYQGGVLPAEQARRGEVLVDCLFGSGLTRPLSAEYMALLTHLAAIHSHVVAIDLPSGIDSDLGQPLNRGLPRNDLTIALGAWKFAHFLMPAAASMGTLKLVDIGVEPVGASARAIARPHFEPPGAEAHKYTRGLLGVLVGAMPGAALLAAHAAQGAGAGYVRLHADAPLAVPNELVVSTQPLAEALTDKRIAALLVGPGLGRDARAREKLTLALAEQIPAVLDADALVLLAPRLLAEHQTPLIATPHEGELLAMERAWDLDGAGSKVDRAVALALASGMVVVAKGADTVVAAPDGRLSLAHRASSWLSTAGTGDVLAGTIASRLANGADAFEAACQGVWLHGEAARLCWPGFGASELANSIRTAFSNCL